MFFVNGALICLAIVVMCYFFWNCCQKVFFIKRLNTLPGPKTLPLIGSIHHVWLKNNDDFLNVALKLAEDYPSYFQLWMGSKLFIGIYEPDVVKIILQCKNCRDKGFLYKFISPVFGKGLVTAPTSLWTQLRRTSTPAFSSQMLQGFFNTFVQQSITFTHELEKVGLNGNEIILLKHISNCTWRIACDSLMGTQLDPIINNQCVKAIHRLQNAIVNRLLNIKTYIFDNLYNLIALRREQKTQLNFIHSIIDKMIEQREDELNNPNSMKDERKRTHRTFFDVQMNTFRKENLIRAEVRDNILTMILAANDTISVAMNFVIFMLANFPEIQEKVYKELLEIYGTEIIESAPIKYDDLKYMHYLDRVIKETMRIFPPFPIIGRQVTQDLKIGEIVLPEGTDIVIGIMKMHRDEKYWENPLVFDPDRFLPERIKDCHSCYLPFSDGPRNCIGMRYGTICMKVMLATLVRTFIFKVNKSIEIDEIKLKSTTILLSTKEPLKVKIEKRYFK